jgi:hypothetical protein
MLNKRVQVGVDHRVPMIRRHLVEHGITGDACIVDQDVHRTKVILDLLERGFAGFIAAHVPLHHFDAGLGLELVGSFIVAGITGDDLVPGILQRGGNGSTNSARTAGDDCNS